MSEKQCENSSLVLPCHPQLILDALDKADCEESLLDFVRHFWDVVEPGRKLVEGRALEELCNHLEAVADGRILNLLANVVPGAMKSLLTCVFLPAWVWGPKKRPSARFLCFSYSAKLTERDNLRFVSIIQSEKYQRLWGDIVQLDKTGQEKVSNKQTGWKIASSVGGTGTGERGDFLLVDDPHNVKEGESEAKRESTLFWWQEVVPTRLNDYEKSSKIVIMQRVHDQDISGNILEKGLNFVHLMLPMEYDQTRHCETPIGGDWRTEDGELLWPERFSRSAVDELKREMGDYAVASQFQQSPSPRGGGIIKTEHWNLWDEEYAVRLGLQNHEDSLKYPHMDLVIGSIDSAYTEDKKNDFSAMTVWGVWRNEYNVPKVMLMDAWEDRLELHGKMPEKPQNQSVIEYLRENKQSWGLVERVCYTAKRFKIEILLIENKASGKSVSQEMQRLFSEELFNIIMIEPSGDKIARAYASQPAFSSGTVYAPDRGFADKVITRCAAFPKVVGKDIVDTVTMAITWMRNTGWLLRANEADRMAEREASLENAREKAPLYDL